MNTLSTNTRNVSALIFIFSLLNTGCTDEIVYAEGGYPYPKSVTDKDTTFWCYPLKDILSTQDSFQTVYYNYLFHLFEEQNLSVRPNDTTTFRLIYGAVMGPSAIISLTPTQVIGKIQTKGRAYPDHDTAKLSSLEKKILIY